VAALLRLLLHVNGRALGVDTRTGGREPAPEGTRPCPFGNVWLPERTTDGPWFAGRKALSVVGIIHAGGWQ
jgi:hypothetical protein